RLAERAAGGPRHAYPAAWQRHRTHAADPIRRRETVPRPRDEVSRGSSYHTGADSDRSCPRVAIYGRSGGCGFGPPPRQGEEGRAGGGAGPVRQLARRGQRTARGGVRRRTCRVGAGAVCPGGLRPQRAGAARAANLHQDRGGRLPGRLLLAEVPDHRRGRRPEEVCGSRPGRRTAQTGRASSGDRPPRAPLHVAGRLLSRIPADTPAQRDIYSPESSSISVTRAAICERSERTSVTCANSGWPLSFSITAITPSCLPTRRLSRWAMSWVSTTREPAPIRDNTVSSTPRSSDWASSTMTKASCSDRPRMCVSGSTSNMSRPSTSSMTSWLVTADRVS